MLRLRQNISAIALVILACSLSPDLVQGGSRVGTAASSSTDARPGSVEVSRAGDRVLRAQPGETVTTIFVVRNTAPEERTFRAEIDLPRDWQLVSGPSSFSVNAGAAVRRLVSFRVAGDAEPNSFAVGFRVHDTRQSNSGDEASVVVQVGETRALDVEVLSAPDWVAAGAEYEVALLIANTGNAPTSIVLEPSVVPETTFRLSTPYAFSLGMGETREVVATISSPTHIRRRQRQWFRVLVKHAGMIVGEESVPVDVLPVHSEVASASRFPMRLRINAFDSYRGRGGQVELEGRGPIRAGGTDLLEFGVRTPDLSSSSLFARRDEYHLSYISDGWAVLLGDHRFDLSPLTEFGRRSRGAGVVARFGNVSTTGFYSRSRYALPKENLFGFNVSFQPHNTVRLGANFIDKTGLLGGESVTIRSEYSPTEAVAFDVEFGDGLGTGQRGIAYSAGASGHFDRAQATARFMRTGSDFPGLYQDYRSSTVSGSIRVLDGLDLAGSMINDARGVQQVISATSAASAISTVSTVSTRFARFGPSYRLNTPIGAVSISGAVEARAQSASFAASQEDRSLQSFELRLQYGVGRYTFAAAAERGSVEASFAPGRQSLSRYEFTSSATLTQTSIHASLEVDRGASMYRLISRSSTMLAVGVDGRIGGRLSWSADGLLMVDSGELSRRYRSLSTNAKYALPWGHLAGVRANLSTFGSGVLLNDVAFSYEVPLSVGTLAAGGERVRGVVRDAETGQPVEGAIVRVGRRSAQTGRDGTFRIPVAADGREFLFLDAGSIGLDMVPLIELPRQIDASMRAGQIDIPVARAATITGVVRRYAYSDGSRQNGRMTSVGDESGVVIEITDGVGRYRATTGRTGTFSLPNVRPGTWTVRVVYANLPESHTVGAPVTVRVGPGGEADVELRVVPRRRAIRFIDGGRIGVRGDSSKVRVGPGRNAEPDSSSAAPDESVKSVMPDTSVVANSLAARDTSGQESDTKTGEDACGAGASLPVTHIVARGETLTALAATYYCDPVLWPLLWFSNQQELVNPHRVFPGQEIRVLVRTDILPIASRPNTGNARIHEVLPGETLRSIAELHYGDASWWPRIWMANRVVIGDAPIISAGTPILIPGTKLDASERRIWQ